MSETTTSQSQQKSKTLFGGFFEDHVRRMEALVEDLAAVEAKNADQMRSAIDESAKLMKQSLDYSLELSAEWRKLAMASTR